MYDGKYSVMVEYETVAENMDIKTALVLIGALMEEYHEENHIQISVVRDWEDGDDNERVCFSD